MTTASTSSPASDHALPHGFATTHWSVVLSAHASDTPAAVEALNQLCRDYWYPLYAYIRRQGIHAEDAEDLTQDFLADLLRRESLQTVSPEKGRFRSFLLVALKRFLINAHHRAHAAKRGGAAVHVPFDTELAESRYQSEPEPNASADRLYERRWALLLIERVVLRLKAEASALGKAAEFEGLKSFLTVEAPAIRYADAGAAIGLNENAARVAVHRLRRRFRELFREEIAHTVAHRDDIEDEIRHLLACLGE